MRWFRSAWAKGNFETFFRVTLPLAFRGIMAGIVLSFARALGEFGATLMLAGNIPGKTQTMPLAIFEAFYIGRGPAGASPGFNPYSYLHRDHLFHQCPDAAAEECMTRC